MRIVQVSPFFHPHAGGVESHVRAIAGEMAREGHDVTILTSRYDRSLPRTEEFEGYRVERVGSFGVAFNTPIDPGMARATRSVEGDVLHVHYPPPLTSWFAVRGARARRLPICLTYHCDLYLPGPFGRLLTGVYEGLFLPPTLSRVNRVVVHTRSYGQTSAALRGVEPAIIPSAVDLDRFNPRIDGSAMRARLGIAGKRVVIFTGRLVPHKGVDVLVRALATLPDDVHLVVIGRGPRLSDLLTLARRLGVEERAHFLPRVTDEELPLYLRASDLFAFPSQNRLEGFGLAVAEAMACGLPVVIADMPGVREVIEPGREGLLVEPFLGADLADRIRELLDDPARRQRMGEAARRRAEERFGLPTVVGQLISLYRSLSEAG